MHKSKKERETKTYILLKPHIYTLVFIHVVNFHKAGGKHKLMNGNMSKYRFKIHVWERKFWNKEKLFEYLPRLSYNSKVFYSYYEDQAATWHCKYMRQFIKIRSISWKKSIRSPFFMSWSGGAVQYLWFFLRYLQLVMEKGRRKSWCMRSALCCGTWSQSRGELTMNYLETSNSQWCHHHYLMSSFHVGII